MVDDKRSLTFCPITCVLRFVCQILTLLQRSYLAQSGWLNCEECSVVESFLNIDNIKYIYSIYIYIYILLSGFDC